jgi:rhodanese-related sulfurtransferase
MNFRIKFSIALLATGLLVAFIPLSGNRSLTEKPDIVIRMIAGDERSLSVDQVARKMVIEDTLFHLIDVRSENEYSLLSLPGAVNIPYAEMLKTNPTTYLADGDIVNIFYSNDDYDAGFAMALATGMGYLNCAVMKGGLNEWFRTIMNSKFNGERLTARENALFETRTRAAKLFTGMNSLPDSLKSKYLNASRFDPKKLDGGCE